MDDQSKRDDIADQETPSAAPPSSGRRVLVVDDDADSAAIMAMLLRSQGHVVDIAHDGVEALEALSEPPDVALVDIDLPGLSGWDVARRFRDRCQASPTVLVAVTGHGGAADRRRSAEAGFSAHLTKPIDFALLRRMLHDPRGMTALVSSRDGLHVPSRPSTQSSREAEAIWSSASGAPSIHHAVERLALDPEDP